MYKFIHTTQALVLTATLLTSCLAAAADDASIPFTNFGTIRNWQAGDNNDLYVQSSHKEWFHATFYAPCLDLPFALGIAFVTEGFDRLDKYSSIRVGRERCQFKTFEKSDGPPPKPNKGKDKAAKPAEPDVQVPAEESVRPGQ